MDDPMTLEVWRGFVLGSVARIGSTLGPEDDWMPTLLLDTPRGLGIVPLEGKLAEHEALPQLAAMIVHERAHFAARVQMSYQLDDAEANRKALLGIGPRPAEHPDRTEHVTVVVGSTETLEAWDALVLRTDDGVGLGTWVSAEPGGPVAESMRSALTVATRRN